MANSVTLQTLISRTLQRCNLEGSIDYTNAGNKFCTAAEVTDLLNVSLANEVYDLLRVSVGDNYYRQTYTFTTNGGQTIYQTPANLCAIISVDIYLGGQVPVPGRRYYEWNRDLVRGYPLGWNFGYPVFYQLQGSGTGQNISFASAPMAAYQIDLNYVPTMTPLVNLSDAYDDINFWSEIAVLDAAARLSIKDGNLELAQYLDARRLGMKQKIQAMGSQRHAGEPEAVNMIEHRPHFGDGWID